MNTNLVQRETVKVLSKVRYYILQGCPIVVKDTFEIYKPKQELLSIN